MKIFYGQLYNGDLIYGEVFGHDEDMRIMITNGFRYKTVQSMIPTQQGPQSLSMEVVLILSSIDPILILDISNFIEHIVIEDTKENENNVFIRKYKEIKTQQMAKNAGIDLPK